jgi:hypothetical protein
MWLQRSTAILDFCDHIQMCQEALQAVMMVNSIGTLASHYSTVRLATQTEHSRVSSSSKSWKVLINPGVRLTRCEKKILNTIIDCSIKNIIIIKTEANVAIILFKMRFFAAAPDGRC